jgi:hypothetical protein
MKELFHPAHLFLEQIVRLVLSSYIAQPVGQA